jgi:hypothetical protein
MNINNNCPFNPLNNSSQDSPPLVEVIKEKTNPEITHCANNALSNLQHNSSQPITIRTPNLLHDNNLIEIEVSQNYIKNLQIYVLNEEPYIKEKYSEKLFKDLEDDVLRLRIWKCFYDKSFPKTILQYLEVSPCSESTTIEIFLQNDFSVEEVLKAKKTKDPSFFGKYVHAYCKKFGVSPEDFRFYNLFDPDLLSRLNFLKEVGYPFNSQILSDIFHSQNYVCIIFFLRQLSPEQQERYSLEILRLQLKFEDPKVGEIVSFYIPKIAENCTLEILSEAVLSRRSWFLNWILNQNLFFDLEGVKLLIPLALKTYTLLSIKILCNYTSQDYNEIVVQEFFSDNYDEKCLSNLTKLAIMSPLTSIYELVVNNKFLLSHLQGALKMASLLVRFPHQEMTTPISPKFQNIEKYLAISLLYAKENRIFIEEANICLLKMSREELLARIVENRYQRLEKNNSAHRCYKEKTKYNLSLSTSLLSWRYGWSLRHLKKITFDGESRYQASSLGESVALKDNLIEYSYSFFNKKTSKVESYVTTYLGASALDYRKKSFDWFHTSSHTILALEDHMEEIHFEILNFNLKSSDQENKQKFLEMVARGYWLTATLCEMLRGTPHNAMIWLNLVYEHHRLPPPIPKLEHFFLDNTALMLPVDRFVKEWETFFEPTFEQFLEKCNGPNLQATSLAIKA